MQDNFDNVASTQQYQVPIRSTGLNVVSDTGSGSGYQRDPSSGIYTTHNNDGVNINRSTSNTPHRPGGGYRTTSSRGGGGSSTVGAVDSGSVHPSWIDHDGDEENDTVANTTSPGGNHLQHRSVDIKEGYNSYGKLITLRLRAPRH